MNRLNCGCFIRIWAVTSCWEIQRQPFRLEGQTLDLSHLLRGQIQNCFDVSSLYYGTLPTPLRSPKFSLRQRYHMQSWQSGLTHTLPQGEWLSMHCFGRPCLGVDSRENAPDKPSLFHKTNR